MRALVIALALLVGLGSTDALARDAAVVKLRGNAKAKPKPKAKPAKRVVKRRSQKPRVAKSKPAKKSQTRERLRPMP